MAAGYGQEFEDQPEEGYRDPIVVNITDEEVKFEIAGTPGSRPKIHKLRPFGSAGGADRINIAEGYAMPYVADGKKECEPIIQRKTRRHVYPAGPLIHDPIQNKLVPKWPAGPRLPMVVHERDAKIGRERWLSAVKVGESARSKQPVTVQLEMSTEDLRTGRPVRASVQKSSSGLVEDFPDDEIDSDPDNDDLPVAPSTLPTPPAVAKPAPTAKK
jgi:hypothetical protein